MVCFLLEPLSFEANEWHFHLGDGLSGHAQLCPYEKENSATASGENPEPARRLLSASTDELGQVSPGNQDQRDRLT